MDGLFEQGSSIGPDCTPVRGRLSGKFSHNLWFDVKNSNTRQGQPARRASAEE